MNKEANKEATIEIDREVNKEVSKEIIDKNTNQSTDEEQEIKKSQKLKEVQEYHQQQEVDEVEDYNLKFDKRLLKAIISTLSTLVLCMIGAFFINYVVIINAKVPTSSMENTIMTGDRIVGNRFAYSTRTPNRGEVVIFRDPDELEKLLVKRVIGMPGDKVEIVNGYLYLNDELTDEPYTREDMVGDFGPYNVPEGNYFMLGDNRNNSIDSRFWTNTFVPKETILGKAMFVYYPEFHSIN